MDVTAVLINDSNSPWYNNPRIIPVPGWPINSKIKIGDLEISTLDAVREKKVQAAISFYEIGAGHRQRIEFGNRDLRIEPRYYVDIWSYNDLILSRIAEILDDYYSSAILIDELWIKDFKSNGKVPTEELSRKQFILKVEYLKGVTL